jgi:hypothetical protein
MANSNKCRNGSRGWTVAHCGNATKEPGLRAGSSGRPRIPACHARFLWIDDAAGSVTSGDTKNLQVSASTSSGLKTRPWLADARTSLRRSSKSRAPQATNPSGSAPEFRCYFKSRVPQIDVAA